MCLYSRQIEIKHHLNFDANFFLSKNRAQIGTFESVIFHIFALPTNLIFLKLFGSFHANQCL